MNLDILIHLAVKLGKQKMVVEVQERCSYPGSAEELKASQEEYQRRLDAFVEEVNNLLTKEKQND